MIAWLSDIHTWAALLEIIGVNIVLSGDNAVVIALACRTLPPKQQRLAIFFGAAGAIVLRALLTVFAALLLARPYLKLIGGALLLWIAVKLLLPEDDGDGETEGHAGMFAAIKTSVCAGPQYGATGLPSPPRALQDTAQWLCLRLRLRHAAAALRSSGPLRGQPRSPTMA